jgi:predicted phage terminase large subunit-like protein
MTITKEELRVALRLDFATFAERSFYELNPQTEYLHNWHIDVISDALYRCLKGKLRRLIINLPPRSLKSHMASIVFPAFLLGHNSSSQIICASYAQDLADKHAGDCRSLIQSPFYRELFPGVRFSSRRPALNDFTTTEKGFRLSTSVGGVLTGRGADFIIIDDPLKPDEALSETQRNTVNGWFDHTVVSRQNNKTTCCIVLIMQRLHEDDLVGHVLKHGDWEVLSFPAIAETDEIYTVPSWFGTQTFTRRAGEALHAEREPLESLGLMRETQGEYNFAGQYQQSPSPLGGGMVKISWFKTYAHAELPAEFELIFQSWDTANKTSELNDYSVCTTWGLWKNHLYLLHVYRHRLDYPDLRRAVKEQAEAHCAETILIEDKASGTQLIQDLRADGVHGTTRYETKMDKIMRMHSVSASIENGLVHIPVQAFWLAEYLHELSSFPKGKFDDQVDSTSQALDWIKNGMNKHGVIELYREEAERLRNPNSPGNRTTYLPGCTRAFPVR